VRHPDAETVQTAYQEQTDYFYGEKRKAASTGSPRPYTGRELSSGSWNSRDGRWGEHRII
jgi:hypothetical protein